MSMEKFFHPDRKSNIIVAFYKFMKPYFCFSICNPDRIWRINKPIKIIFSSFSKIYVDPLLKIKFIQNMKPGNVIDMKMAEKKKDWFILFYILVDLIDPVTRVKDNIIITAVY